MSAIHSLRHKRDFAALVAGPARGRSDGVTARVRLRDDDGPLRLGLAVPARVGRAVARNRVRRRLRAAVRAGNPPRGVDLLLKVTPEVREQTYQELEKHVASSLARALEAAR